MALSPVRAAAPPRPPVMSIPARRELTGRIAAVLFLEAAEAGADKAAELDGELLDCCAAAHGADLASETFMDSMDAMTQLLLLHLRSGEDAAMLAASLACDVVRRDQP